MDMTRRRRLAVIVAGVAVLAIVAGYFAVRVIPRTQSMHVSWAVRYQSLADLKASTNVAVAGRFTGVLSQGFAPTTGIPYTEFSFAVDKVLYDPLARVPALGGTLRVHQTGSVSGNLTTEIDDDPLFSVGQTAVLFLREYAPGYFAVVGGPQGRFGVSPSGQVSPFNSETVPFVGTEDALSSSLNLG